MNKKKLMQKLGELVDTVNSLNRQLTLIQKENEELKTEIENLKVRPLPQPEVQVELPEIKPACNEEGEGFKVNTDPAPEAPVTEDEPSPAPEPQETSVQPDEAKPHPVTLPDAAMEYGSCVIGKIVVEAARYAEVVSKSSCENKKELLNLIMGKAEVAKAEVFGIVSGPAPEEAKKELTDAQFNEALDYFKSVAGQI